MISFRLTVVLCALVFGQSLASTIQSSTAVEGKEIDALVKIVDLLEKLGDKAIDIASKLVDYNIKNYDDLPNRIGKHINEVLQKIADHIIVYVDKVRKVVNKDASTVLQCAETSLKVAFLNSADDVQAALTCVQPDLKKVLVILPPVLEELNAVLKKVEGVTVGLKKCDGLPLKELACVADVSN
ncbi:unnamed protein product [Callosobruchus maculatus]|uniref:Protein TsetseEP domain-containing protein n=1 Tax=Callosobruchus maculatus TaxID=64391 RepID=A0A653BIE5_CALMS|nr:unnamed protein product [Callosobruchus maculatus]